MTSKMMKIENFLNEPNLNMIPNNDSRLHKFYNSYRYYTRTRWITLIIMSFLLLDFASGSPSSSLSQLNTSYKKRGVQSTSLTSGSGSSSSSSSSPILSSTLYHQNSSWKNGSSENATQMTSSTYLNDFGEICNADAINVTTLLKSTSSSRRVPTPVSNFTQKCRKLEIGDIKKHSLLMIKAEILRKLRLDEGRLPNVSAAGVSIPKGYLAEFIHDYQGDSPSGIGGSNEGWDDDEHALTEKIIAFAKIGQKKINGHSIHHFSFSGKLGNLRIKGATLHVHLRFLNPAAEKRGHAYSLRLMEIVPTQAKGESPISIQIGIFKPNSHSHSSGGSLFTPTTSSSSSSGDDHMVTRPNNTKWVQLEVKDALVEWMGQKKFGSSKQIALIIEAVEGGSTGSSSSSSGGSWVPSKDILIETATKDSTTHENVNNVPFIEIQVSENGKSRPPRNLGMTCGESSQEDRCCRYPLTVDFEDFGWDWIIAPKKYDANYCSGKCPYAFLQRYPHNHIVQQANPSGVGGPCCAARKMSSISMLYFDSDSNIVFSVLPGMVVDKCGCS